MPNAQWQEPSSPPLRARMNCRRGRRAPCTSALRPGAERRKNGKRRSGPGMQARHDTALPHPRRNATGKAAVDHRDAFGSTAAGRGGARNPREPDVEHGAGLVPGRWSPPLRQRPWTEGTPAPPRPIRRARGGDLPSGSGSVPLRADFCGDRRIGPPAASGRVDFTADSSCPGSQCARSDPGTAARLRNGSPGALRSPPGGSIAAPLRRPRSRRPLRRALTTPGWGSSFCLWPPWWR